MPIQGETIVVRHRETAVDPDGNIDIDDGALAVTKPDLTMLDPAPTVSLDPISSEESSIRDMLALVSFADYGMSKLEWSGEIDDEQFIRPDYMFTAVSDIWSRIRGLVGQSEDDLTDETIDYNLLFMIRRLEKDSCLGTNGHASLSGDDKLYFDQGLVYLSAYRYALQNPNKMKSGAIKRQRQGPVEWEYAVDRKPGTVSVFDVWLDEALDRFNLISCFAEALDTLNSRIELYATAGPRKKVQTSGPYFGINELYIVAAAEQPVWVR